MPYGQIFHLAVFTCPIKIDNGQLTQAEVHKAMGHAKFQTTVDFYDTRSMVAIAAKLWGGRTP